MNTKMRVNHRRPPGATPVPVDVRGAESEAVVKQRRVDDGAVLRPLQQVAQVTQVSVAASDAVPGAVLVQNKHLARAEPSLQDTDTSAGRTSRVLTSRRRDSPGCRRCR